MCIIINYIIACLFAEDLKVSVVVILDKILVHYRPTV